MVETAQHIELRASLIGNENFEKSLCYFHDGKKPLKSKNCEPKFDKKV